MLVGVFFSGGNGPIDEPPQAGAIYAWHEHFFDGFAVDQHPRPALLVTLIMGEPLFVNYFPRLVDGVLVLDIHWGEEQAWDELGFPQGEGDAVPVLDILLN